MGGRLLESDVVVLFLSLALLLLVARALGEAARRLGQPSVVGELLAGVLLGPTVLGAIFPEWSSYLFPRTGNVALALNGFMTIAITLFLLVAGMEVDLSSVWRQGRVAITVSIAGIVIPFGLGVIAAYVSPRLMGREDDADQLIFALFLGTALAISALPVIAKTLMDLNIYRTDLGMMVIPAAVVDDLTGWLIFALILGMLGPSTTHGFPVSYTVALVLAFTAFILTAGRWMIHRVLPWVQAHTAWPGGVLSFAIGIGFIAAAFTEWVGVHAIFGAFLVGVAFGDSSHLREQTRTIIHQFVSFIFAPLFFASVGLTLNFAAHFRWQTTLLVLLIACAGKILGCGFGARLAGIPPREAWAIGFAMNARGAMEIILGVLALQRGVIRERMFVALVIMAIVTSVISGPAMRRLLRLRNPRRLDQFLSPRSFLQLVAPTAEGAIRELAKATAAAGALDEELVAQAVLEREAQGSTAIANGLAIPHARLAGLRQPVVGIGISHAGIDFNSADGEPTNLVFMLLTPQEDDGAQIEILSDLARKFGNDAMRQSAVVTKSFTEFLALLRTQGNP